MKNYGEEKRPNIGKNGDETKMNSRNSYDEAIDLIKRSHASKGSSSEPLNLLITGESGVGKTYLVKQYLEKQDKENNILVVTAPFQSYVKALLEEFLFQMDDPFALKGTISMKLKKIIDIIKFSKIELIVVDDVQHLIAGRKVNTFEVLECIVHLMNQTEVPFVFLGDDNSKQMLELNKRLARRVSMHFELNHLEAEKEKVQ